MPGSEWPLIRSSIHSFCTYQAVFVLPAPSSLGLWNLFSPYNVASRISSFYPICIVPGCADPLHQKPHRYLPPPPHTPYLGRVLSLSTEAAPAKSLSRPSSRPESAWALVPAPTLSPLQDWVVSTSPRAVSVLLEQVTTLLPICGWRCPSPPPDAEAETPILWHLIQTTGSLEKTLKLGKIEGRMRSGWQRMRWLCSVVRIGKGVQNGGG